MGPLKKTFTNQKILDDNNVLSIALNPHDHFQKPDTIVQEIGNSYYPELYDFYWYDDRRKHSL